MSHEVFLSKYLNIVLWLLLGIHHTWGESGKQEQLFIRGLCQRTRQNLGLQYPSLRPPYEHTQKGEDVREVKHCHLYINLVTLLPQPHIQVSQRICLNAVDMTNRYKLHRSTEYRNLPSAPSTPLFFLKKKTVENFRFT